MAKAVQFRRGTSTENDAFTGLEGEITVDTTNKKLRVHDGSTKGGVATARDDQVVKHVSQSLTTDQQKQALSNIGAQSASELTTALSELITEYGGTVPS